MGILSAAKACTGVGSVNSAWAQRRTFVIESAIAG
jgi:hypothetical protein